MYAGQSVHEVVTICKLGQTPMQESTCAYMHVRMYNSHVLSMHIRIFILELYSYVAIILLEYN
jgi:hypothetical protein